MSVQRQKSKAKASHSKNAQRRGGAPLKMHNQRHFSRDTLHIERSEPLHVLRSSQLSGGAGIIRRIPIQMSSFPLLKMFADTYQKWKLESLVIEWVPSVGSLVNGEMAIISTADTSLLSIPASDLYVYANSDSTARVWQVGKKMRYSVPSKNIRGTVGDGEFHSRTTPSDPGERMGGQVFLCQLTKFTTMADADAVDTVSTFGEFKVSWRASLFEQAPISHDLYPAAAALTVPTSVANNAPLSDVLSRPIFDQISFQKEKLTIWPIGNPSVGEDHITWIKVPITVDAITTAMHSSGARPAYRDFAKHYLGLQEHQTDSPFTHGSSKLWIAVAYAKYGPRRAAANHNTALMTRGEDHVRRDVSGVVSWITDKVDSWLNDDWNEVSHGGSYSAWDLGAKVGTFVFSLLLAALRDSPENNASSGYRIVSQLVLDALNAAGIAGDLQAKSIADVCTGSGTLPHWIYVTLSPDSPVDNIGTAASTVTQRGRSRGWDDFKSSATVTENLWTGLTPDSLEVVWPFAGEPPLTRGGSSKRTIPNALAPVYDDDVVAAFNGAATVSLAGGVAAVTMFQRISPASDALVPFIDLSLFEVYGLTGPTGEILDLDSNLYTWTFELYPVAGYLAADRYELSVPAEGYKPIAWAATQLAAGVAGWEQPGLPITIICGIDKTASDALNVIKTVDQTGIGLATLADLFPTFTGVINGDGVMCEVRGVCRSLLRIHPAAALAIQPETQLVRNVFARNPPVAASSQCSRQPHDTDIVVPAHQGPKSCKTHDCDPTAISCRCHIKPTPGGCLRL